MSDKKGQGGLVAVGLLGLGVWALSKGKPAVGAKAAALPPAVGADVVGSAAWIAAQPSAIIPITPITPVTQPKPETTKQPVMPLETWQSLTVAQLASLPVISKAIPIGAESYNPTPTPVAIGDTGFKVWGTTSSGATVVSKNEPSSYPPDVWF